MLSGLVPLNADFMRYIYSISSRQRCHQDNFEHYFKQIKKLVAQNKNLRRYRSEIALQAQSFGAELQTK